MSATFLSASTRSLRFPATPVLAPVVASAKAIGVVLYGDESRTRASLVFGFACVSLYAVAFSRMLLCNLG